MPCFCEGPWLHAVGLFVRFDSLRCPGLPVGIQFGGMQRGCPLVVVGRCERYGGARGRLRKRCVLHLVATMPVQCYATSSEPSSSHGRIALPKATTCDGRVNSMCVCVFSVCLSLSHSCIPGTITHVPVYGCYIYTLSSATGMAAHCGMAS